MAEIKLTAMGDLGPLPFRVSASKQLWPSGGSAPTVRIGIGRDTIEVWPADPDRLEALGREAHCDRS